MRVLRMAALIFSAYAGQSMSGPVEVQTITEKK